MTVRAGERAHIPSTRRWRLRTAVIAVSLLIIPAQLLAIRVLHREPYPALYQPSFGGVLSSHGAVTLLEPQIALRTDDGSTRSLTAQQLLPDVRVLAPAVLQRLYWSRSSAEAPSTVAWTRDRLEQVLPDVHVTAMDVRWVNTRYQQGTESVLSREVSHRTAVPLTQP